MQGNAGRKRRGTKQGNHSGKRRRAMQGNIGNQCRETIQGNSAGKRRRETTQGTNARKKIGKTQSEQRRETTQVGGKQRKDQHGEPTQGDARKPRRETMGNDAGNDRKIIREMQQKLPGDDAGNSCTETQGNNAGQLFMERGKQPGKLCRETIQSNYAGKSKNQCRETHGNDAKKQCRETTHADKHRMETMREKSK